MKWQFLIIMAATACGTMPPKPAATTTEDAVTQPESAGEEQEVNAPEATLPPAAREFIDELKTEASRLQPTGVVLVQTETPEALHKRLAEMVALDQFLRNSSQKLFGLGLEDEAFNATMNEYALFVIGSDKAHTAELKEFVDARGWPTISAYGAEAANNAWLLAQHADQNRDFQRDVLARMERLVEQNEVEAGKFAFLYDRVAVGEKRLQRFGTQGHCVGPGLWEPFEMEDPDNVDARRAAVGLGTLQENKARFTEVCQGADPT